VIKSFTRIWITFKVKVKDKILKYDLTENTLPEKKGSSGLGKNEKNKSMHMRILHSGAASKYERTIIARCGTLVQL
jgi:hypothetical protein